MRYEMINGQTHIHAENGEEQATVLRAVAKASFDMARPAGFAFARFDINARLTEADLEHITLPDNPKKGAVVLNMDYVHGRQCATVMWWEAEGHFVLNNRVFEPDRGEPEPMLEHAANILAGQEVSDFPLTSHMFKGRSLDLRLREWGFERQTDESDWDFRSRVFPKLFGQNKVLAFEIIMGMSIVELDEMNKMLYQILVTDTDQSHAELNRFVQQFHGDPQSANEVQAARTRQ